MTNCDDDTDFDCLEFERRAQERIYEEIKDLTPEEELEYWRHSVDGNPFGSWWQTLEKEPLVAHESPSRRVDDPE